MRRTDSVRRIRPEAQAGCGAVSRDKGRRRDTGMKPPGEIRAANGSETEVSRVATNSTRVTNATELAKQGWRPNAVEASGSGLRPEDRLVSVERTQGRVAGPSAKVSQARQVGRTLTSHGRRRKNRETPVWSERTPGAKMWYN